VYVYVKNVGNSPLRTTNRIKVSLNERSLVGSLYAPDDRGGLAGGPVNPGETGKIVVSVPVGTFRHCQVLKVHVDVGREIQASTDGSNVFANDQRSVVSREARNNSPCRIINVPPNNNLGISLSRGF
jgi:hypothetical protein